MKIRRDFIQEITLEALADRYDLTFFISERTPSFRAAREGRSLRRFYGGFDKVEVKENGLLLTKTGEGDTEQDVIADYQRLISGQRLVFDAMGPNRIEFGPFVFPKKQGKKDEKKPEEDQKEEEKPKVLKKTAAAKKGKKNNKPIGHLDRPVDE